MTNPTNLTPDEALAVAELVDFARDRAADLLASHDSDDTYEEAFEALTQVGLIDLAAAVAEAHGVDPDRLLTEALKRL